MEISFWIALKLHNNLHHICYSIPNFFCDLCYFQFPVYSLFGYFYFFYKENKDTIYISYDIIRHFHSNHFVILVLFIFWKRNYSPQKDLPNYRHPYRKDILQNMTSTLLIYLFFHNYVSDSQLDHHSNMKIINKWQSYNQKMFRRRKNEPTAFFLNCKVNSKFVILHVVTL